MRRGRTFWEVFWVDNGEGWRLRRGWDRRANSTDRRRRSMGGSRVQTARRRGIVVV